MATMPVHEELVNLDVSGFSVLNRESGVLYCPAHWHTAIELAYCSYGHGVCRRGNVELAMEADTLLLINSMEIHAYRSESNSNFTCIHIEPQAIDRFMPGFSQYCFDLDAQGQTPQALAAKKQLVWLVQEVIALETLRPEGYQLKGQSLLFDIVTLLVRHFSKRAVQKEPGGIHGDILRLEPLINYLQQHHREVLTLDDAAAFMGLNKEYFCRLFKRTMGISFLRYLNTIRVMAVARDLTGTDSSIAELMELHGFTNQKLFNKMFRELYGCTPSQKRKTASV